MILSTTVWIIWLWIHQCFSLSPQEISFLEHLEYGAKDLNLRDFLDPPDDKDYLDDQDVLNSTLRERFPHRRVRRSTNDVNSSPIRESSKKTITGVAKDEIFSKDFQSTNLPVISSMVSFKGKNLVASVNSLFTLTNNAAGSSVVALPKDNSRADFVSVGFGDAILMVDGDQAFLAQLLKEVNGVMQLNFYNAATNSLIKTLYFDDGTYKNIGRVHVTAISALNSDKGWYIALTYPKADGLQKLRIYYTTGTDLKPVPTNRFEYFSGAENMRDIDAFLAGGERYLAIARETSSLLFKFTGDEADVTFKMDSVLPGSEKIVHFKNEFGQILMTLSGTETNTYLYHDGLFAKMAIIDNAFSDLTNADDRWLAAPFLDSTDVVDEQNIVMITNGNSKVQLFYNMGPLYQVEEGFLTENYEAIGVGWVDDKIYLYHTVPSLSDSTKLTLKAHEVLMKTPEVTFDSSKGNVFSFTMNQFEEMTNKLNGELQHLSNVVESPEEFIPLGEEMDLTSLQVEEATFEGFSKLDKIDLTLIHASTDASFVGLNYAERLDQLSDETTISRTSPNYLFKNVVLKNAANDITIQKTLNASKVTIKNADINEIDTKEVSGPAGTDQTNVNDFITKSLRIAEDRVFDACPRGWTQAGDDCYQISSKGLNWEQAKMYCSNRNGYLAEVKASEQNTYISAYLNDHRLPNTNLWIGLKYKAKQGGHQWDYSKEFAGYSHWDFDEPHIDGECTYIKPFGFSNTANLWRDGDCGLSTNMAALCQLRRSQGLSNAPLSLDYVSATDVKFKEDTADASSHYSKIEPNKMLAKDAANTIGIALKAKNMELDGTSNFPGKINDIRIENVVIKNSEAPIDISGIKTFSNGLILFGNDVSITTINGKRSEEILQPNFVYTDPGTDFNGKFKTQTIQTKQVWYNNLIIKDNLEVSTMGARREPKIDVSSSVLENIVRTDQVSVISGDVSFSKPASINNLVSSDVNGINPHHMLINGVDQNFPFNAHFDKLIINNNFKATKLNGIKLESDIARTDQDNAFSSSISFGDLAVKNKVDTAHLVEIDGVDVSEMEVPKQKYDGTVTVTGSLFINQNDVDVSKMEFFGFTNQDMSKEHLRDLFIYKDTIQDLPNLETIGASTTCKIDDMYVRKTLDGLHLTTDVMHNDAGAETTNAKVHFFGGVNKVYKDMLIGNDKIGSFDVADLYSHIYCPDSGITSYGGIKTVSSSNGPEVISLFDVELVRKATFNSRDFITSGNKHYINKNEGNEFTGKMTFSNKLEVSQDFKPSSDVLANDYDSVKLNGINLKTFDSEIVKKSGTYTVITPVTMSSVMSDDKKMIIKSVEGVVDDRNIEDYLNARVLLDEDHPINVDLTANSFEFKKGLIIQPQADDEAFFCGKNLIEYKASLYKFTDSTLSGDKHVEGVITVGGNLAFPANVHPFNIDLVDLRANALSRTSDQKITVPYTIDSVSSVNKMVVDKVDGVDLDDLCLINAVCEITCSQAQGPCLYFKNNLKGSGDIKFENLEAYGMDNVLNGLDSNTNKYNLELLTLTGPTADLDWSNDKTDQSISVSYLYDNLVVHSNKDWLNRNNVAIKNQEITGDTTLNGRSSFDDVTLTSGIVNEDLVQQDGLTEFRFDEIVLDAARSASANTFTSAANKTFTKEVKAKEAEINKLKNVVHYDDIHLASYRNNMLEKDDEENPGSDGKSQTISGTWTLDNGIEINDRLNVEGAIDGVEVEDFVLKNVKTKLADKEIPKVTFKKDVTVKGNVETPGTTFSSVLKDFMDNRISLSDDATIRQKLIFTGGVTVTGVDTIINKLNDIPAETWVKSGVDVDTPQMISGKKVFTSSDIAINGNLITDSISTDDHVEVDLSSKYADTLKINEDAIIAGPNLQFVDKTYVTEERVSGDLPVAFHDVLSGLVTNVSEFVKRLYTFYDQNILNVIPKLDKEAKVANRLNLGNIGFIEEVKVPDYLKLDSITGPRKIVLTSALELDDNVYSINAKAISGCSWDTSCSCESTIVASPMDSVKSPPVDVDDRVFTFTLDAGTFTVQSSMESYSQHCKTLPDPGKLIVSGFIPDDDVMKLKFNKLSPLDIGITFPFQDLGKDVSIGYVKDVVMWEKGQKVYLAVASVYRNIKVAVFSLDTESLTWRSVGVLNPPPRSNFDSVDRLKIFKFMKSNSENFHLYIVRRVEPDFNSRLSSNSDILVYIQDPSNGNELPVYETLIPADGFVDFEVFKFLPPKPPTFPNLAEPEKPQIMLTIACNLDDAFMTNYASLKTFTYEVNDDPTKLGVFRKAIVPNNNQEIGSRLVGIEVATITDKIVFVIAERNYLQLFRYVPFQGLFLIDTIPGNGIVDFAVFEKSYKRDSLSIFVVEMENKSKLYRLSTKDFVPKVSFSYGRLN
ncbi:hypothetical protein CMK18_00225 [Candidatus Poribacteria bacterium]|nr:hypothetical protein [Candidatus Poribacteria bacterium]